MTGEIKILYDYPNGEIIIGNKKISFTYMENEVLNVLLKNKEKYISARELVEKVYGSDCSFYCKSNIATIICRVRKKLSGIIKICNKHGYGYRIKKVNEQYIENEGLYEV